MKPYSVDAFAQSMDASIDDLRPLLTSFVEEGSSELDLLAEAIEKNDLPSVKSIAHNLKGISANMEMDELNHWCRLLDTDAKASDTTHFADFFSNMQSEYKILEEMIRKTYNL